MTVSLTARHDEYLNDLHVFDATKDSWTSLGSSAAGRPPSPRAACASAVDTASMTWYFHGGNVGECRLNDLHALHLKSLQWHRIACRGAAPSPRAGHTLTVVGQQLHIFGGGDSNVADEPNVYNDHFTLDVGSIDWTDACAHWANPAASGVLPAPRAGHTAAAVGHEIFVVAGGTGSRFLNDVHVLDTLSNVWRKYNCGGAIPPARAGHSMTESKGQLYVFGGGDVNTVFHDLLLLNTMQMVAFPMSSSSDEEGASAGNASSRRKNGGIQVIFVPGLEAKLRKRMKKEELVRLNILKEENRWVAPSVQAAQSVLQRKQLDKHLKRVLEKRDETGKELLRLNILKDQQKSLAVQAAHQALEKQSRDQALSQFLAARHPQKMTAEPQRAEPLRAKTKSQLRALAFRVKKAIENGDEELVPALMGEMKVAGVKTSEADIRADIARQLERGKSKRSGRAKTKMSACNVDAAAGSKFMNGTEDLIARALHSCRDRLADQHKQQLSTLMAAFRGCGIDMSAGSPSSDSTQSIPAAILKWSDESSEAMQAEMLKVESSILSLVRDM